MVEKHKTLIESNIVWVITTLVTLGIFIATIRNHSLVIEQVQQLNNQNCNRLNTLDVNLAEFRIGFQHVQKDIAEIKADVKDLKRAVNIYNNDKVAIKVKDKYEHETL